MARGNALPRWLATLILRMQEGWQNGYCTSLENWRPQGLGGSNPSPSVRQQKAPPGSARVAPCSEKLRLLPLNPRRRSEPCESRLHRGEPRVVDLKTVQL